MFDKKKEEPKGNRAFRRKEETINRSKPVVKKEDVKIKHKKPPIFDAVCNTFGMNLSHMIFTYGDTIYVPNGQELPDHIIEHEKVHMKQQSHEYINKTHDVEFSNEPLDIRKMTPELWWGKFLREPAFRVDQEARAYARQYRFICKTLKDKNARAKVLYDFAGILSGKSYGNCISHVLATKEIKKFTGGI